MMSFPPKQWNLSNIIMHNIMWAGQKTATFVYIAGYTRIQRLT